MALALLILAAIIVYSQLVVQNRILVGYDALTYFYPNERYAAEAIRSGRLPLWNPFLFTGVPFLANVQTGLFYPPNLLFLVMPVPSAYAYSVALHVFLAAAFSYAFAIITLRLGRLPSLVTAFTFALSGFIGAQSGHLNQLQASVWLPLLLVLTEAVYRKRRLRLAIAGSFVPAIQFLAGHMQEFYLSMIAVFLLVAWLVWRDLAAVGSARNRRGGNDDSGRTFLVKVSQPIEMAASRQVANAGWYACFRRMIPGVATIGLMLGLGAGLVGIQLLPTYELTKESIRAGGMGYADASSFSLPPWLLLRALLPAHGDPQPFSEWIGYVGVVPLILGVSALLRPPRHRFTAFFAILAALSLTMAIGQFNPLYPLIYDAVPGLDLFRVPARWLLLYTLATAALAGIGAQALPVAARSQPRHDVRRLGVAILVLGTVLLLFALAPNPRGSHELPGWGTTALWAAGVVGALGLVALAGTRWGSGATILAPLVVGAELFLASQTMDFNRVNLPEAVSTLRPAVAHLRAQTGVFRVLPFSEGAFDPGDLALTKAMVGQVLSPDASYDYVVAGKHKETLTPNLPLFFRIPSLDGYDGGVLPLRRYVELKSLLPLVKPNTPDGRLREQLATVPATRLLSWLNVKYVLMDRVHDAWIDGVYYDLGLSRSLPSGVVLSLPETPGLEATSLGIVSHLEGAQNVPGGAPVAQVVVSLRSGATYTTTLRAGSETAEGRYAAMPVAHREARRAQSWRGEPAAWDYISKVNLPSPDTVTSVRVVGQVATGEFVLRGISLVDDRRGLSEPVVIDPQLRLTHLADVKIYENREALERAFLVHDVVAVPSDEDALATLRQPAFDPTREAVVAAKDWQANGSAFQTAHPDPGDSAVIVEYEPELVRVATNSATAALLVLTDSYYPGWQVSVDGRPAPFLRVDHLFRGVPIPPGRHEVVFHYRPDSLRFGGLISVVTLAVVCGSLVVGNYLRGPHLRRTSV